VGRVGTASASTCSSARPAAGRGIVGHATSPDGVAWTIGPPLSAPTRHVQLEVPQLLHVGRRLADPVLRRLRRLPACTTSPRRTGSAPTRARRATCCRAAGRASTTPARCSSTRRARAAHLADGGRGRARSSASSGDPLPLPRFA
jgi:hypothetical protein